MKLDASMMKYQTANEFRVLVSIEMGMKNHEIVPTTLIWFVEKRIVPAVYLSL